MASGSALAPTARRVRTALATCAMSAGLLIGTVFAAPGAMADPGSDLAAAKREVDKLQQESAALDQDAREAQELLDEAKKALATREGDEKDQQAKVEQLKTQLRQVALAQYQDRVIDPSTRIAFSSASDDFVTRYATIHHVTSTQNELLQDFQSSEASLAAMRRDSESDVAVVAEQERKVAEAQAESDDKLKQAQQVLNRLTEEERQRLAEEERQREQAAQAAATSSTDSTANESSSTTSGESGSNASGSQESSSGSADPAAGVPDSDRVGKVLATAKAQLGKPYVRAGNGPGSFDCSGLTSYAYKAAGVSLPRVSRAQIGVGTRVSRADLQPGDLVFYYSPISHVAIYVGNGQVIHASRPGKPVGYAPVGSMPFAGATRVL